MTLLQLPNSGALYLKANLEKVMAAKNYFKDKKNQKTIKNQM